jgi:hypothetical protein
VVEVGLNFVLLDFKLFQLSLHLRV